MEFFEELWENPYLRNMIWSVVVAKVIWLMLDPDMAPGARRFAPSASSAAIASARYSTSESADVAVPTSQKMQHAQRMQNVFRADTLFSFPFMLYYIDSIL